jgi:hypothetical protein
MDRITELFGKIEAKKLEAPALVAEEPLATIREKIVKLGKTPISNPQGVRVQFGLNLRSPPGQKDSG